MRGLCSEALARFWSRVEKTHGGCWEWQGSRQTFGHGLLSVKGVNLKVHRISYEIHHGPIPPKMCVRHTCDNPPCVNPAHLVLGTRVDNNRDRDERGRQVAPLGEAHGMHKLTLEQVHEIRSAAAGGQSKASLARRYGISEGHTYRIVSGDSWAWAS